jgi:hypothetical protein
VIWDSGVYQITGWQAAAAGGVTDIVAVTRGEGLANCEWVRRNAFRAVARPPLR